ncbi:hypothetical protein TSUD_45040 [Trifolium subterraneum]|nr:hypothetical protein TSUD_45040 [Trifolium subterraneum]
MESYDSVLAFETVQLKDPLVLDNNYNPTVRKRVVGWRVISCKVVWGEGLTAVRSGGWE